MATRWYAAHIVMLVQFKEIEQTYFPIWENVILIKASTVEEAFKKAEERAHEDEGDSDCSFIWDGQSATWVYYGTRKVVTCVDPECKPGDGTEVTYSELTIHRKEDLDRFVNGEEVTLTVVAEYLDDDDE